LLRIFHDLPAIPGEPALAEARRRAEVFAQRWGGRYPRAVACVVEDFAELTAHLQFPAEHWPRIRHSNLIERTFGETRRRVKVIGRLLGERSCLSLAWAVLDRAGRGWRGVDLRPANVRLLQRLRHQLTNRARDEPQGLRPPRSCRPPKIPLTEACATPTFHRR
jgi:putative transposase